MRTILTIKEQHEFLNTNWNYKTLTHKWSCRGYGNSKVIANGEVIAKAGGCGYDRFGAAIGEAIAHIFGKELNKLARRECKGKRRDRKGSEKFYGLFYDSVKKRAWVDGGCGSECMKKILNKIGFSLEYVGESEQAQSGEAFYSLVPVTKHNRRFL